MNEPMNEVWRRLLKWAKFTEEQVEKRQQEQTDERRLKKMNERTKFEE